MFHRIKYNIASNYTSRKYYHTSKMFTFNFEAGKIVIPVIATDRANFVMTFPSSV